ncbi:diacylglycerol/lipid kinase family protein [Acinetobacter sp. MD2(2019)]|uniref:diacylglycerol/lipid kinase family protein n=1 Tax=Acinetobacter sp. MD2(2019) TaxID=2605273 RepID=UPI002D1E57A1|nr:diacylglycerol kinase family protein [Acinetobacter sp. MD2(2019)]MEB3753455.1 diacylglycerol kinase [Acinetobacter sp. MD2(2019)]
MVKLLKPLSILYNEKSGFHAQQKEDVYEQMMTIFTDYGFEIQVFEFCEKKSIDQAMQEILHRHQQFENKGVVVAAGGDGTLNSVAGYLMKTDIPLGVLPLGTFNYVARAYNIPLNLLDAAKVIATGQSLPIHVARLNHLVYLNNASLGLYPLFIEKREYYNRWLGRFKIHAYTSALDVLFRKYPELKLEIVVDGEKYPVKTPLIFFGNNTLQLQELNLKIAQGAKEGRLAGIVVAKSTPLAVLKLLIQLVRGEIEKAPQVYSFSADSVEIYVKKAKTIRVAVDGELRTEQLPLKLTVEKNALNLMVPYVVTSV